MELGDGDDGYRATGRLRASADWLRDCPIIAFTTLRPTEGEAHFLSRGLDAFLPKPFARSDMMALASRWLGVGAANVAVAGSRLTALLGKEQATLMIDRLFVSLEEAVAAIDAGEASEGLGHRLGGLAGTLGFPVLSASWLALQDGDSTSWPTVRALTLESIAKRKAAQRTDR